jgi:transcriptional regulator with XRE-family HTH domain
MTQPLPQPQPAHHPLRAYRDRYGLTQSALAKSLGVSSITISRWETGARKIDDELLALVAQKTGIPRGALRPDLAALLQPSAPGQR